VSDEPIQFTARIVGAESVTARLKDGAERARAAVRLAVARLAVALQRRVKERKLTGQVLNVRTGRLRRSINFRVTESGDEIVGAVGTNVEYGRLWELGGVIPSRVIEPRAKGALYWPGAAHPVARVTQPERVVAARPFLRPALDEMRARIRRELSAAIRGAL
jgi:phage gpG-like protein